MVSSIFENFILGHTVFYRSSLVITVNIVDTCLLVSLNTCTSPMYWCYCRYLYTVTLLVLYFPTRRLFSSSTHMPRGYPMHCCFESIKDRNPPSWSNRWIDSLTRSHTRMWPRTSVQIPKGRNSDHWPV